MIVFFNERRQILDDDGRRIIRHHSLYQPQGVWSDPTFVPIIGDRISLRDGDDPSYGEYRVVDRRFSANGSLIDCLVEAVIQMNAEEGGLTTAEMEEE